MSEFTRYSLFPIQFPKLYDYYKKQRDAFWVPAEVDLETDVKDWRVNLTDSDRKFLLYTLSFFAQADGIVLRNLNINFSFDVDIPEANLFFGIQAGIEAIHWEMYSLLIETLITDPTQKDLAFNAIENYPCIKAKAEWMESFMTQENSITERLIAFACAEGIFFSSAFASIFYYKKKNLLPGMCLSNKFISRDEGLHRDFGCELFKLLNKKFPVSENKIREIVESSVNIESTFVNESLNSDLIGIDSRRMCEYVKFVADHLLTTLGLQKIYNAENPFDWMESISLESKQNFFEGRVSEYKKQTAESKVFDLDADF